MKIGDKIIFPEVTSDQLNNIGVLSQHNQNKIFELCGKEVTIKSIKEGRKWGYSGEFIGVFEIQESIFGFPLNWIILK